MRIKQSDEPWIGISWMNDVLHWFLGNEYNLGARRKFLPDGRMKLANLRQL
jgi:hypothetical protein